MNIGIIYGGRSTEHDASIKSKENFCNNLDNRFNIVELVFVDRLGNIQLNNKNISFGDLINHVKDNKEIFYINLLHGQEGEDGSWSGVFDIIDGIGSFESVITSSILMNKYYQSCVVNTHFDNLYIPKTFFINKEDSDEKIIESIKSISTEFVIVKPNSMGASHFTEKIKKNDNANLLKLIRKIFEYDDNALIQEFIDGDEYTCGIIELNNNPFPLPIIHVKSNFDFLDHKSKHIHGSTNCDFDDFIFKKNIEDLSCELFKLFNIIGMCRFDFLVGNDKIYFLEGNLIPGFSSESAMPMMLKQANISLSDFMENLVRSYLRKQKNSKYLPYHID